MHRDNRRFQRGSATYTCQSCGKLTRETGSGESQTGNCLACFNKAGQENAHADNHTGRMIECAECQERAAAEGWTIDSPCWADARGN